MEGAKDRDLKLLGRGGFRLRQPGVAFRAEWTDHTVLVGTQDYLTEQGVEDMASLEEKADELRQAGNTVMFVGIDGKPAGLLAVADPIKESTPEAIETLHRLGLRYLHADR